MRIHRLEVTHCAGIAAAGIDFKPGLNVLHGPNELGKSSLVATIRAALLLQPAATAAEGLKDWNTGQPAGVSLSFEQEAGRHWRVRKTFGQPGRAHLDFSKDGLEFVPDSAGRAVGGTLQSVLRWGIEAPGGRGGRRGMPSSLITTALLGEQSDVVAILDRKLDRDPDASGRERLIDALQALAEDPRFKQVIDAVQGKVDEAFTATGRRRRGHGSPWDALRKQRETAALHEHGVSQQADESAGVRARIENANAELAEAHAEKDRLTDALARHRLRDALQTELAEADREYERVASALRQLATNEAATTATTGRIEQLDAEHAVLKQALAALARQAEAARADVHGLESGADEQQRRLREQETENQRLELCQELATHKTRVELATRIQGHTDAIEQLETKVREKRELLRRARERTEKDQDQLVELELEFCVVGYRAAEASLQSATNARDAAHRLTTQASDMEAQAAALGTEADALDAPDEAEMQRLRDAETAWRVADGKRSVGFLAEVTVAKAADAEITTDGASARHSLQPDAPVDIEAKQELTVRIGELATLRVRGGGRSLVAEAEAAATRWQDASAPVFLRTGCGTLEELTARAKQAEDLRDEARDLSHQAETARSRAADIDQLEQRVVTERATLRKQRTALAEYLDDGETVDALAREFGATMNDESTIRERIEALRESGRERERLSDQMDQRVGADQRDLDAGKRDLADARDRFEADVGNNDWQRFLSDADATQERFNAALQDVEAKLGAVRTQATAEVDAAREKLADLNKHLSSKTDALQGKIDVLGETGRELARLQGETGPLRVNAAGLDADAARERRDQARREIAAVPALDATTDITDMPTVEREVGDAGRRVADLEAELRKAEGALEQMGGQYLDEQLQQAKEAVTALDGRERELELDYGAWQLLRETLTDAEQSSAVHLGNALVEPVSRRMGALTGGRYGDIAIGPQLDATGIDLAGGERPFDALSVGTQEQLALLLRLAIAEALGTFLILDDQLTQSDGGRMAWMRDLLADAAARIQVIVLTCHPDDYRTGASHHVVDLTECLTRSDASATTGTSPPAQAQPEGPPPSRRRRRRRTEEGGTEGMERTEGGMERTEGMEGAEQDLTTALRDSLDKDEG